MSKKNMVRMVVHTDDEKVYVIQCGVMDAWDYSRKNPTCICWLWEEPFILREVIHAGKRIPF